MALACSLLLASGLAFAYTSGSTGADGAFNPTTSQSIQLPPSGIFNYTSVNIPVGVTINYIKNATNTPVTILATGDVTIAGAIDVSATQTLFTNTAGLGGPGGYDGGQGGNIGGEVSTWVNGYGGPNVGGAGIGPGGGQPGSVIIPSIIWGGSYASITAGGGGSYGVSPASNNNNNNYYCPITPGVVYGNTWLLPLIGGSGGGGGVGGPVLSGSGGGGGGGAILIAASGSINVWGSILANGGSPAYPGGSSGRGSYGGGGSGGGIRLIATTVTGNGSISVNGGYSPSQGWTDSSYGYYGDCTAYYGGGLQNGGAGRVRIEAENMLMQGVANVSIGQPNLTSIPGLPTLSIATIAGINVPAQPSGNGDVSLPVNFTNPVTVTFITTGVTVGSTITLTVTPPQGATINVTTNPTTGTTDNASASATVNLLSGANTLQATVSYTVVASVGDALSVYAQGERVEKVNLASTLGGQQSQVTLTTVSGKQYKVPATAKLPG